MPSLTVPMNPLCDLTFVGQNKKLPYEWSQPQGDPAGTQYGQAFEESEKSTVPEPACYYWAASTNKYHTDTCKEVGGQMKDFCHAMLDGIKTAFDACRMQAKFKDLKVAAVCAIGTPGCLDFPELESNIKNMSLPAASGNEKDWRDAVAAGVSSCWKDFTDNVTVPGLPWYPAYATFPSPQAPPMPNVPMPLIACPSTQTAKIMPSALESAMCDNFSLDDPDDQFVAAAKSIATALSAALMAWLPMQQPMLVLGKGPVPIYAPPFVPVGPVVMGDNIATPGHLGV